MNACPFCAKEIPAQAIVCPHCGRGLTLGTAGYPIIKSALWIGWYILTTTLVRSLVLFFGFRWLAYGAVTVILAGVASLAILGYGVFRAQQHNRLLVKVGLLIYGGVVVYSTWGMTSVALSQ